MEYIKNSTDFKKKQTAVALGKFDGFHRGHQLLLDELLKLKIQSFTNIVFTFDVPTASVLEGEERKQIFTNQERAMYLEKYGIDVLLEYPFTKEFSMMEPEEFVKKVLIEQLGVRVVVVGYDFHFGKNRKGNVRLLEDMGVTYGFHVIGVDKVRNGKETISSSLIRKNLIEGQIGAANQLLGRPYSLTAKVVKGNHLGRTISIPTANQIVPKEKLTPKNGVYLSRIFLNGRMYDGVSNLGVKPTVSNENTLGLETHVLDFNGDLYQQEITVELLKYVREEMKFSSVEALSQQMNQDIEQVKVYLRKEKTLDIPVTLPYNNTL